EEHAAEDKRVRELAEVRNRADQMAYQIEKMMKENEAKLRDSDKAPLEAAVVKVREAAKGEDIAAIRSATEELEQASHAFSKILYESAQQGAAGQAEGGQTG